MSTSHIPAGHKSSALDLSDYARPLAIFLTRPLVPTRIRAPHITSVFIVLGLLAAYLFARGGVVELLVASLLMQMKNILDAMDGTLARLQNRPSRFGRFLDTIGDVVVNVALFGALGHVAYQEWAHPAAYWLAGGAILTSLVQWSVFNFYAIRYRLLQGGEQTSQLHESAEEHDTLPTRVLLAMYRVLLSWQDNLVAWNHKFAGGKEHVDPDGFFTAVSFLGPGCHILALNFFAVLGVFGAQYAGLYMLWITFACSAYYAGLLLWLFRRRVH